MQLISRIGKQYSPFFPRRLGKFSQPHSLPSEFLNSSPIARYIGKHM